MVYSNNLEIGDGTGTSRRVLLEGDPLEVSYTDLTDKPDLLQVPPGPAGASSDAPGYVATSTHESNTIANEGYGVESLDDPQLRTT